VTAPGASRGAVLVRAAGRGAVLGLGGVAAMTLSEKIEQVVTARPNSHVPGRALLTLLRHRPADEAQPVLANHAMHWGTGALLGTMRGVWAAVGVRGPRASLVHTVVRLAFDQTVENTTGVGAPPRTWPRREEAVDVLHKAVYAFATGLLTDRLISPTLQSRAGKTSH